VAAKNGRPAGRRSNRAARHGLRKTYLHAICHNLSRGRRGGPAGAADITVRVIECHLQDAAGQVTETFALITTLLDPQTAPPREPAELYRAR